MTNMAALIAESESGHHAPVSQALFDTSDPSLAAAAIAEFVAVTLAPVRAARFARSGVGLVLGLNLEDGRDVVTKVHRWNVTEQRLAAVQQVQRGLHEQGIAAPRPLVTPTPLGNGLATVDELLPGSQADGHDPGVRAAIAAELADFIAAARQIDPQPDVGASALEARPDGALWGDPHDMRFDFDATASGAEWIDELARDAKATLAGGDLESVIAHLDWRVENLGFDGTRVVAIYDWDSVGRVPEPVAVGQSAAQFSADWRIGPSSLPSVAEMRAFVADYETRRGNAFSQSEWVALDAANLLLLAYSARCEHSDRVLCPELAAPADHGLCALLRERAAAAGLA